MKYWFCCCFFFLFVGGVFAQEDSLSVFVPNVFTPNGDGIHDSLMVEYGGSESFHLSLYGRWGNLVFESDSPTKYWTGNEMNGKKAAEGVYYYLLEVGKRRWNGNVTLMR